MAVGSDSLLAVLDEWKTAARKHREEQQRWESSGDFQRALRQELMAEIYDICSSEIRAVIVRAERGCTNGIIRSLGRDNMTACKANTAEQEDRT